ncbi:hypothetical protein HHX47_DHR10000148 [Lentinula edodes]|nr:hypothetical protein HHX47_DHR10000148 [Lentinula edodes]
MSTYNVTVSGISPTTTETHLHDFFSIASIDHKGTEAAVNFEKPSAAKTALMLNGGSLDGATLTVTSDTVHPDEPEDSKDEHIDQTDKPRAGKQRGISKKFLSYFNSLDTGIGSRALGPDKTISGKLQETLAAATQQAKTVDEQKGVSKTAHEYYTKALGSPFGKKVFEFYTSTSKQVLDIHEEAKRIHSTHKATTTHPETPVTTEKTA